MTERAAAMLDADPVAAGLDIKVSIPDLDDPVETATDPVCDMAVPLDDPPATVEHDEETYYFWCAGCADMFAADPNAYLDDSDA